MRNGTKRVAMLVIALAMCATYTGRARADVIGYATDNLGNLLSVDLTTATANVIGSTGLGLVEGLALNSNGTLYATDDGGRLYTLNRTTGAVLSTIGTTGLGDIEGLAFSGSTLIGSNYNSTSTSFYSINAGTAVPALLTTTNPGVGITHALTITGATTADFLADSSGTEGLYSINLTTGATTKLGAINPISGISGALAAGPGGILYSLDSLGYAYTVSNTGVYTQIGFTGNHFYLDLTIVNAAVPEPSSLVLCGIAGLSGLGYARRRKRST